jgi:hypothetical protein
VPVGGRCAFVSNILDHECLMARRTRAAPENRREAGQARTDPSVRISANLSSVELSEYTCEPGAASPAARPIARDRGRRGSRTGEKGAADHDACRSVHAAVGRAHKLPDDLVVRDSHLGAAVKRR